MGGEGRGVGRGEGREGGGEFMDRAVGCGFMDQIVGWFGYFTRVKSNFVILLKISALCPLFT